MLSKHLLLQKRHVSWKYAHFLFFSECCSQLCFRFGLWEVTDTGSNFPNPTMLWLSKATGIGSEIPALSSNNLPLWDTGSHCQWDDCSLKLLTFWNKEAQDRITQQTMENNPTFQMKKSRVPPLCICSSGGYTDYTCDVKTPANTENTPNLTARDSNQ